MRRLALLSLTAAGLIAGSAIAQEQPAAPVAPETTIAPAAEIALPVASSALALAVMIGRGQGRTGPVLGECGFAFVDRQSRGVGGFGIVHGLDREIQLRPGRRSRTSAGSWKWE